MTQSTTGKSGEDTGVQRPTPGSYMHEHLFIGGTWLSTKSTAGIPVLDSGTERELGRVVSATTADVDAAVAAARTALPDWSTSAPHERAQHLLALHENLSSRSNELASIIAAEVGTAIRLSADIQVSSALAVLKLTAELLLHQSFQDEVGNSLVTQEPVGVVAAITPWNYPLFQVIAKVAPALAAGCTVVHKPSELAPLSAFVLAQSVETAGLPLGVYNLVSGPGVPVGEAMAAHPGVNMVSFTGSTSAGTRVYELAAKSIKRVALELGGKSASVLLDDADLPTAVKATVNRAFLNSGQTCDAWTRLIVPSSSLSEVLELAEASANRLTLGDPFDDRTRLGPLVSARQVQRVRDYVEGALDVGAVGIVGGPTRPEGFECGFYFRPTILSQVTSDMRVAQEEIFGPVLVVMTYGSEADALDIVNDTSYGLSGAVWSVDEDRALAFGRRVQAGQVVINGGRFNPLAPFGGVKQSGIGRELGRYGIQEFLEPKAFQL